MNNDDFRLDSHEEHDEEMPTMVWIHSEGKYLNTSTGNYHNKFITQLFEKAGLCIIEE